jgi:hypothetical protein
VPVREAREVECHGMRPDFIGHDQRAAVTGAREQTVFTGYLDDPVEYDCSLLVADADAIDVDRKYAAASQPTCPSHLRQGLVARGIGHALKVAQPRDHGIDLVGGGFVIMLIGAYFIFRPPPPAPVTGTKQSLGEVDLDEIIKQIRALLLVFQKNLRVGIVIMIMGLVVVCLGVFVAVRDTKDEVKDQTAAPHLLRA